MADKFKNANFCGKFSFSISRYKSAVWMNTNKLNHSAETKKKKKNSRAQYTLYAA